MSFALDDDQFHLAAQGAIAAGQLAAVAIQRNQRVRVAVEVQNRNLRPGQRGAAGRWDYARPNASPARPRSCRRPRTTWPGPANLPGRTPCRCRRCTRRNRDARPPSCRASSRRGFGQQTGFPVEPIALHDGVVEVREGGAARLISKRFAHVHAGDGKSARRRSCLKIQACCSSGSDPWGLTKVGAYQIHGFEPSVAGFGGKTTKPALRFGPTRKSSRCPPNCRERVTGEISAALGGVANCGRPGRGQGEEPCGQR